MQQGILLLKKKKKDNENSFSVLGINTKLQELMELEKCHWYHGKEQIIEEHKMLQYILRKLEHEEEFNETYYDTQHGRYFEIEAICINSSKTMVSIADTTVFYRNGNGQRKQTWDIAIAMGTLVAKRDLYTAEHQRKVAILAAKIAMEMKLPKEQAENICIAGMLHDIGKMSIPSEILTKPDKLTLIEYELIKTHVNNAFDMLNNIEYMLPIAKIVKQHHEKLDGSGYPEHLAGDEIMLEAKILAVADVCEAITSHRPYRPSLGYQYANEYLHSLSDIQFDKEIVKICMKVMQDIVWDTVEIERYLH